MADDRLRTRCPVCRGSGFDRTLPHRGTNGGRNDYSCPRCHGECYIDLAMAHDHQHSPDPNANAARIVGQATASNPDTATDLEAAWAAWSAHVQKVDERGMTLLRAAFEAGWEAGRRRAY